MLKYVNGINFRIRSVILLIFFSSLCILFFMTYASRTIHYKYGGVKYQIGNPDITEPVTVEIKGRYRPALFGGFDEFKGQIKIGDETFEYADLVQKHGWYKKIPLSYGFKTREPYGNIYFKNIFRKMTIQVYEQEGPLKYGWSPNNGWLISAPSANRKEAVVISNNYIKYLYPNFLAK